MIKSNFNMLIRKIFNIMDNGKLGDVKYLFDLLEKLYCNKEFHGNTLATENQ